MCVFEESTLVCSPPWVDFEHKLSIYRALQCDKAVGRTLRQAIEQRMKESSLGIFLRHLNRSQQIETYVQLDKLDRLIFDMGKGLINMDKLRRNNDICDDLIALIETLLQSSESGEITINSSLRATKVLRLTGSHIVKMDESIRDFSNLEALILAGNCLTDVPGGSLPRRLMILEVSCNLLQDLSGLLQDCPPYLQYLGLARNYINITQDLQSPVFSNIFHLDLSQNNIDDLRAVISDCLNLSNLGSLLLIGNPCSMVSCYKDFIASKFRKLSLLDGASFKSFEIQLDTDLDLSGSLQISFCRLLSLPQPPNEKINKKKVINSFRIEVDCPMLRAFVPKIEENFEEGSILHSLEMSKQNKTSVGSKKSKQKQKNRSHTIAGSNKNKQSKATKQIKSNQKMMKTDSNEDLGRTMEMIEYELFLKEQISTEMCFISGSKTWNKIIEFDNPTIEIPNCNLLSLRDTFRSYVIINIVHLKTLPATKRKASEKKKTKKSSDNSTNESKIKDILVSKNTIAKVRIPLQDILWNLQSLDYIWHKNKPLSVEHTSGLKDLKYSTKGKKSNKPKKGKEEKVPQENILPTVFTCHFGIGVKRTEINPESSKKPM